MQKIPQTCSLSSQIPIHVPQPLCPHVYMMMMMTSWSTTLVAVAARVGRTVLEEAQKELRQGCTEEGVMGG